jgi:hypothetical protein
VLKFFTISALKYIVRCGNFRKPDTMEVWPHVFMEFEIQSMVMKYEVIVVGELKEDA